MKFAPILPIYLLSPMLAIGQNNTVLLTPPAIQTEGSVISYVGFLNALGTRAVLELIQTGRYQTLRIESRGGEVIAAMEFGSAVFEHQMDVIVSNFCVSSCANYIFPAGRTKEIEEGAFVLWHGDARQRNFMEELHKLEYRENAEAVEQLTDQERRKLAHFRLDVKIQDAFYSKIGIVGSIARIGQEIPKPVQLWALPVVSMVAFGLKDIDAPPDYGTPPYCQAWVKKYTFRGAVSCLALTNDDILAWQQRQKE
ncbi:MAG: hypothetical protein Q8R67_05945 [Rhodoferax sp.]|nr:hypothetical protein [Rhodoferax sp.]MDP3651211.1 hypothetical protein [Rhodoferax sp.]